MNCPVPKEQIPFNEYKAIKQSCFYKFPLLKLKEYFITLLSIWTITWIIVTPIILESFSFSSFPFKFILVSTTTANIITNINLIRLYLAWSYIGKRLLSAAVIYEESGWYDGQIWIKPSEIATQDRLINNYKILPVLVKIKTTLIIISIISILQTFAYIQI